MSEKQQVTFEHDKPSFEHDSTPETEISSAERAKAKEDQSEILNQARAEANEQSVEESKTLEKLEAQTTDTKEEHTRPIDRSLKRDAFNKEIKHIRHKLSKPDRLASKVIHQPVVKAISEVSSKTISRPSGLLGGGITAFVGTGVYLYIARHIGLKYNYTIFLLMLLAGFVLGIILEGLVRLVFRKNTAKT